MTPDRFWELVATLGGTADDGTTPTLDAALLESGEGGDFGDLVAVHVERLLQSCSLPLSHQGDGGEWVAAAVIAAGRETYERTLAAGGPLSPDDWRWEEAEDLLVAGSPDDGTDDGTDDQATPGDHLGLTLEWKTLDLPEGVTSTFTPDVDFGGLDPSWGHTVTDDPAWAEAVMRLDADAEFHRRRDSIAEVGLHVKVLDSGEVELSPWPSDEQIDDVVMTLPREMFTDVEQRAAAYVDAVVELVLAVQERLRPT